MSNLTKVILWLAAVAVGAAVWAPGAWWKWLITSFVLVIVAAVTDLDE